LNIISLIKFNIKSCGDFEESFPEQNLYCFNYPYSYRSR